MTSIEWTDRVWNPLVGCSRVSKGCEHCYAERVAHRGMSEHHRGLTVLGAHGPRWTGEVRLVPEALSKPLSWRKPCRVFVNSMSDLFHEAASFETIAAIFGVMAAAPRHTFQVLTKRPARAREFFESVAHYALDHCAVMASDRLEELGVPRSDRSLWFAPGRGASKWPLPNVWLGVSVEDQATADARIPVLLELPAALWWVSYEPALGPVDFAGGGGGSDWLGDQHDDAPGEAGIDWIVVGGESGPGARPFDVAWARSTVTQCREAGVPVFVKQLGARPVAFAPPLAAPQSADSIAAHGEYDPDPDPEIGLRDRKGGDMSEWPEDLRVREWPEVRS